MEHFKLMMKLNVVIVGLWLCYICGIYAFPSSSVLWERVSDSYNANQTGIYGVKGKASDLYMPGARCEAVGWYDAVRQEFWLFGGIGFSNNNTTLTRINDLWRYRVNDSTWAWISGNNTPYEEGIYGAIGTPSSDNLPGARSEPLGWYDSINHELWFFGGFAYRPTNSGEINDLWRYQMNDDIWTWMSGDSIVNKTGNYSEKGNPNPSNMPGARRGSVGWYDSFAQELWLFGGFGQGSESYGYLNDLWKYQMNDSTWIWVSGDSNANQPGIYGEKGIPNPSNVPGARSDAIGWYDSTRQEFWLFGGRGYGATGEAVGLLNDLWKYQVNDSTWTWVSGSNSTDQRGLYGEKGRPSKDAMPAARDGAVGCFDNATQEFWLFGGKCKEGYLNDLWRYRVYDATWTWMSGSNSTNDPGNSRNVDNNNAEDMPGARESAVGWYDSSTRSLWFFGGIGFGNNGEFGYLNEIWRVWLPFECPPLHGLINGTCVQLVHCLSDDSNSSCLLTCDNALMNNTSSMDGESVCMIDGDVIVDGRIVENKTISVIGVINVTGDVTIVGETTVRVSPGSVLHVGKCLVLDEDSHMVVVVDGEQRGPNDIIVLATYDASCSSVAHRVRIESALDECRHGRPTVTQKEEEGGRRARLELLFVPSECDSGSDLNIVAICVAVPIAFLVVVTIVVIFSVPKVRSKVFPFAGRKK